MTHQRCFLLRVRPKNGISATLPLCHFATKGGISGRTLIRRSPWLGLLVVAFFGAWHFGVPSVLAQHTPQAMQSDPVDQAMERFHIQPAFWKLGRGLSNILGGWLEIPLNVHERYNPSDTVGSVLMGAAVGLFKGVARTSVGVYETATFWLPIPEDFAPILPTIEYFQKVPRHKPLPLE